MGEKYDGILKVSCVQETTNEQLKRAQGELSNGDQVTLMLWQTNIKEGCYKAKGLLRVEDSRRLGEELIWIRSNTSMEEIDNV